MSKAVNSLWEYLALAGICYNGLEGVERAKVARLWYRRFLGPADSYHPNLLQKYMIEIHHVEPEEARRVVEEYETMTKRFSDL